MHLGRRFANLSAGYLLSITPTRMRIAERRQLRDSISSPRHETYSPRVQSGKSASRPNARSMRQQKPSQRDPRVTPRGYHPVDATAPWSSQRRAKRPKAGVRVQPAVESNGTWAGGCVPSMDAGLTPSGDCDRGRKRQEGRRSQSSRAQRTITGRQQERLRPHRHPCQHRAAQLWMARRCD